MGRSKETSKKVKIRVESTEKNKNKKINIIVNVWIISIRSKHLHKKNRSIKEHKEKRF